MALLEVRDLATHFFTRDGVVRAVDGVSFTVERGKTLGIVGESGSGKSSLLRLLCGLDHPTAGSITFDGREVAGVAERKLGFLRERVQVVFQDPMGSLDPRMRVRDIVAEPLAGRRAPDVRGRVAELLAAVGLPPDAGDRYPHQFSGGQRQRICIARALAMQPELLVADEAVSALDVSVQAQVLALLAEIRSRLNLAMLFITHDLRVAAQVCDQVAVMQEGRIVEYGPAREVFLAPRHEYTRALFAAAPGRGFAFAG